MTGFTNIFVAGGKFESTYHFELNENRIGFRLANSLTDETVGGDEREVTQFLLLVIKPV